MKWFQWLFQRSRPGFGAVQPLTGWAWNSSLLKAWQDSHPPAFIDALERGADPNLLVPCSDNAEESEPLLVAAARQNAVECIEALIRSGVDLEKRAPDMFATTALGVALMGRKWEAARSLALAGASWDSPMWVMDSGSLAAAMSMGGLDPCRIKPMETTIHKVATGQDVSLRDQTLSTTTLHLEPGMRHLLADLASREKGALLEERLAMVTAVSPTPRL